MARFFMPLDSYPISRNWVLIQKTGCPTLAAFSYLRLGWEVKMLNHGSLIEARNQGRGTVALFQRSKATD